MAKFSIQTKTVAAVSRKEWLRRRRSAKDGGAATVINRVDRTSAQTVTSDASGLGEEALALLNEMFERVNIGSEDEPVYAIHAKYGLYSDSFVSAGGMNTTE